MTGYRDLERIGETLASVMIRRKKFLSDKDQRRLPCCLQSMRMACNGTCLLDQQCDHGVKAVVFSQWTRTHDILIRRLAARGIGYVRFHGSIAAEKRPVLVEQFRDDPDCRVFFVDRCRGDRAQSAIRLHPGEHGSAVEPRLARTAHWPDIPDGLEAASADHQFHRQGESCGRRGSGGKFRGAAGIARALQNRC